MTAIMLLSDLHMEFHADGGVGFANSLDFTDVDVVVLAGDISVGAQIPQHLPLLCPRAPRTSFLYVPGNHEYYGCTRAEVDGYMREAERECPNLVELECGVWTAPSGTRFLGVPLWYRATYAARQQITSWSDYRLIHDFSSWWADRAEAEAEFLHANLREGDVVVTHFLPSERCIAPRWRGSDTNCFFVHDLTDLILERQPALWCHGHTHDSIDVRIGSTRVTCNPYGYAGHAVNPDWQARFVLTV